MTSSAISPVTLTLSNIADGQSIDASDVTVPLTEAQNNLPANEGYLVSVTENDTHKKHLSDAIQVAGGLAKTIQNAEGDESILLTASGSGYPADGRLENRNDQEPGYPVETSSNTLYYLPHTGNQLAVYSGSVWEVLTFTSLSLSGTALSESTVYDIFAYSNSGTLTLEAVAWSGATTRATALSRVNGVLVLSSNTTRRYLGTLRTQTGGNKFLTSQIWNCYNRVKRTKFVDNGDYESSWSYNSTSWQTFNNLGGSIGFVFGLLQGVVRFEARLVVEASGHVKVGVGLDSTSSPTNPTGFGEVECTTPAGCEIPITAILETGAFLPGYHTAHPLEANGSAGTFDRKLGAFYGTWWA